MDDDEKDVLKVGIEAALRPFANLVEKLFGGAAEQIGGAWEVRLAVRRIIRRIHFYKKLQAVLEEAGFEPQPIPDQIWVPAVQEASLQDDETIQEKWANLLANAADPRRGSLVSPSFPSILKELTAREARFLDSLYERASIANDPRRRGPTDVEFTRADLATVYAEAKLSRQSRLSNLTFGEVRAGGEDLRADLADLGVTIDILTRNRLIRESAKPDPIDISVLHVGLDVKRLPRSIAVTAPTQYQITELGAQFITACRAPSSARGHDADVPPSNDSKRKRTRGNKEA